MPTLRSFNDVSSGFVVGIDASRNRSGGAKAHLRGLLSEEPPFEQGVRQVHVWTYRALMNTIPDQSWLVKHCPAQLERSLFKQLWWQATRLADAAKVAGCDILFSTGASTLCGFKPSVVLSQDMLSYEPGVMRHFGYGKARLRLLTILALQNRAFRRADGVLFLTQHAARVIQSACGSLRRIGYAPHGIDPRFRFPPSRPEWPSDTERSISCIYVSNAAMYKHQWTVIQAVETLRKRGLNIVLTLVGGGSGRAQRLIDKQIARSDRMGIFVRKLGVIPQADLPRILAEADLFVFASSCENMPVTLLEAMASGLPIACSNRGPMPEILRDGGVYFDPENSDSIAKSIEKIAEDAETRNLISRRAKQLSQEFCWARCATETWSFISKIYRSVMAE